MPNAWGISWGPSWGFSWGSGSPGPSPENGDSETNIIILA